MLAIEISHRKYTNTILFDDLELARNRGSYWSCRRDPPPPPPPRRMFLDYKLVPDCWVVTRHQYGISALVSQMSFAGETSGSVAKWRLFSQVTCSLLCPPNACRLGLTFTV